MTLQYSYIAGFLDADGSVTLKKDCRSGAYFPRVLFYNADIGILEAIKADFGGHIKTRRPPSNRTNWNITYELAVDRKKALRLLECISGYMLHKKKKERASRILNEYIIGDIELQMQLKEDFNNMIMRGFDAY